MTTRSKKEIRQHNRSNPSPYSTEAASFTTSTMSIFLGPISGAVVAGGVSSFKLVQGLPEQNGKGYRFTTGFQTSFKHGKRASHNYPFHNKSLILSKLSRTEQHRKESVQNSSIAINR